ncbi:MAG: hypothetical protein EBZ41_04420 [Actinobacteria bacterium]|nr:hypothetical protein [Actinomycetota bacterium]
MTRNEVLQWTGALFIIAGHVLNTINLDGWNILAFFIGTIAFMAWALRVRRLTGVSKLAIM